MAPEAGWMALDTPTCVAQSLASSASACADKAVDIRVPSPTNARAFRVVAPTRQRRSPVYNDTIASNGTQNVHKWAVLQPAGFARSAIGSGDACTRDGRSRNRASAILRSDPAPA